MEDGRLKAWQINEDETWSGVDAEEAIAAAMTIHGPHARRDELVDEPVKEVSPETVVLIDGDPELPTTVGAIVAGMKRPGMVCSTEI